MKRSSIAPQQERSRRTLDALLNACVRVLDREGLAACTVPAVAAEAEVAPATIYRRFADKDSLLKAAFLHVLEANRHTRENAEKAWLRPTLSETVERIVAALLGQYRAHPRLLRGLSQFVDAEPKSEFTQAAAKLASAQMKTMAGLLLRHRERIRHEEPERAVLFCLMTALSAMEVMVLEPHSLWATALPLGDKAVVAEHTRAMVAYLRRKP